MVSSLLEMTGAVLMLKLGTQDKALQVNSLLALVGPFVLVSVTLLGISGLAHELPWWRLLAILVGVGLILFGSAS